MSHFIYRGKKIKKVGLLGIGKSNIAVMRYLAEKFPNIEFTVRGNECPIPAEFNISRRMFGCDALSDIKEDVLFLSPTVRRDKKELRDASSRGVMLSSDAELFFDSCHTNVYGITGSDGKSTTTTLTARLLTLSGRNTIPIGNIGIPFSSVIDKTSEKSSYAAELSSFQLMYMKPALRRCVITNITENHLNWHTSFEEYITAKGHILENSLDRIINFDCITARRLGTEYPLFAVFSALTPESELRKKIRADVYITLRGNSIISSDEELLDIREMHVRGKHNILNFMATAALCLGEYENHQLKELAVGFTGLEHRCENIGTYNGVHYYNSSIDSSPMRTAATLRAMDDKVILILGGRSKGLEFSLLMPMLESKAQYIVVTGECADEIEQAILTYGSSNIKYKIIKPFEAAVRYAASIAKSGDTVLLSPAATSYDEFSDFEERGNTFKRMIKDI